MKLCKASILLSASSTKARMAAGERPCASGRLRGNSAPALSAALPVTPNRATAHTVRIIFMEDAPPKHDWLCTRLPNGLHGNGNILAGDLQALSLQVLHGN